MPYAMVVIGVSLGGLDALRSLLSALPADFPLPLAIVQHRARGARDDLDRILSRTSSMPVVEVEDKMAVAAGRVFLAPQDYHLLLERNRLGDSPRFYFSLSVDGPVTFARPSIDALFESAAEACGSAVIGLILTGASSDGALGLRAVHGAGGLAIVQRDAYCDIMPQSARKQVPSAISCTLEEAAALLVKHAAG